ncbi:tail fiber domain-containing protein [Gymnodinialimonas hymeniacidonis]|uniref:tail fiber domain-containing protein n=1 Tax=Gymnodinialimonas hymeniacidonis TaxID=3126508 RepID=UPI0034C6990B
MKNFLALTLAASLTVNTAFAQSAPQPQMDVTVIHQNTAETAEHIIVPALAILMVLLVLTAANDGGMMSYAHAASDERLKEDIVRIGTTEAGFGIYEWSYIGSDQRFRGVMAQEVMQYRPDAVTPMLGGYLAVNYDALGLTMELVD